MLVSKLDIFALEAGRDFIFHFSPTLVLQREYKSVEAIFVVITLFPHALEIILSLSSATSGFPEFGERDRSWEFFYFYLFIYFLLTRSRFYSPSFWSKMDESSFTCLLLIRATPLTAVIFKRKEKIIFKNQKSWYSCYMAVRNSLHSKYLLEIIIIISCSSIYLKKYSVYSLHSLSVILVHGCCKPYSVKELIYHINEINRL